MRERKECTGKVQDTDTGHVSEKGDKVTECGW